MSHKQSGNGAGAASDGNRKANFGYKPTGQKGYQPHSNQPIDPKNLTPPNDGSAVQPASQNDGKGACADK